VRPPLAVNAAGIAVLARLKPIKHAQVHAVISATTARTVINVTAKIVALVNGSPHLLPVVPLSALNYRAQSNNR